MNETTVAETAQIGVVARVLGARQHRDEEETFRAFLLLDPVGEPLARSLTHECEVRATGGRKTKNLPGVGDGGVVAHRLTIAMK